MAECQNMDKTPNLKTWSLSLSDTPPCRAIPGKEAIYLIKPRPSYPPPQVLINMKNKKNKMPTSLSFSIYFFNA